MTSDLQISSEQISELTRKSRHKRKSKQSFRPRWVKLPVRWVETLSRSRQASTYRLAHIILIEAFKREQTGGEVVLSAVATEMHRNTKARAVNELVKLGLITVKRDGRQAVRVIKLK